MANKPGHRRYGSIRKRESGRYQVRFRGPDGMMRSASETFERKSDAERYLALVESQMVRREWIDPERAKIRLKDYAERWIVQRPGLRPRTVALYTWLLQKHVTPYLGAVSLGSLDTPLIREWRSTLLNRGVSQTVTAKAYRFLRAVLTTATREDELIRMNPCRIPGAGHEAPSERPVLTVPQVFALMEEMPERYQALILLTTFACLRWGEVSALQRQDLDLEKVTVRVRQAFTEQRGKGLVFGPPKSRAGVRIISIPAVVAPAIQNHLSAYVLDVPDALIFTGPKGGAILRGNFNKLTAWRDAVVKIGAPGLHFHDLRHTGNTLAAQTGASLRDLMTRMGHDSPRAALIYQHATSQADRAIAKAVSTAIEEMRKPKQDHGPSDDDEGGDDPDDGPAGALARAR